MYPSGKRESEITGSLTLELTFIKKSHSFARIAKIVAKEYKPASSKNNKFF